MSNLVVSRNSLAYDIEQKLLSGQKIAVADPVSLVSAGTGFGAAIPKSGSLVDDVMLRAINKAESVGRSREIILSGQYKNGLNFSFKDRGSVIDRIRKGAFSASNTLNDNWQDLFDAIRLDLTIKKMARPTIRQYFYNVVDMPNASKDVRPTELFPYGVVFEENNGEGQAVRQAANLGGQYDTIPMKIFAAGFTWTLLAALFDGSYDLSRLTEGVALGESAKKDDIAIAPILAADYTGKTTAASTVGTLRQEKLMNTLMDGLDDLAQRIDPVTKRKIGYGDVVVLASSLDAEHINHVKSGLGNSTPEKYSPLSSIKTVVAYDGETINMPNETITYNGVTSGAIYLVKKNRYMSIPVKRGLVAEIDAQPDVSTLAQEKRAWYFVEGIYNDVGIANFIQKVTLPAWSA